MIGDGLAIALFTLGWLGVLVIAHRAPRRRDGLILASLSAGVAAAGAMMLLPPLR